jgi:hypothetical protein
MAQTKKRQIEQIAIRVLADYGFDPDSAKVISAKLTSEIYHYVPARIVSAGQPKQAMTAEVMLFHEITGVFPAQAAQDEISELMRGKSETELREAYKAWCFKGNNRNSAVWIKWAGNNATGKVVVS